MAGAIDVSEFMNELHKGTRRVQFQIITDFLTDLQWKDVSSAEEKMKKIDSILLLITEKDWAVTLWDEHYNRTTTILDVVENASWFYKLYPAVSKKLIWGWIDGSQVRCWILNNYLNKHQIADLFKDIQNPKIKQDVFDFHLRYFTVDVEELIESGVTITDVHISTMSSKINQLNEHESELKSQYQAFLEKLQIQYNKQQ